MMASPRMLRSALLLVVFALAGLGLASIAAAQTTANVTIYHSLDAAGDDPRPGCPAGCTPTVSQIDAAAVATSEVLIFSDSLLNFVNANLQADLQALGSTVTLVLGSSLPADLSVFDVIWIVKSSPISAGDQTALVNFVTLGGGLHLGGELPSFDNVNDTVENIANALVVGGVLAVGRQGGVGGPYPFNTTAVGGITTTPNELTAWSPLSPGEVSGSSGLDADNVLVTGATSRFVGAVWDSSELVGGVGRLTLLMDWNWLDNESPTPRLPVIENIQHFLAGGGTPPACDCALKGTAGEQLELWIDGGPTGCVEGENICNMGVLGGTGDEICGASALFQITGPGVFTDFFPDPSEVATIDTVVHNPECTSEEAGCDLPPGTKQFRLIFMKGSSDPPTDERFIGTLVVDSRGSTTETPTKVEVFGEAAGASLQSRPIALASAPELVAVTSVPEPGGVLQLMSGLMGLGLLYRLRR